VQHRLERQPRAQPLAPGVAKTRSSRSVRARSLTTQSRNVVHSRRDVGRTTGAISPASIAGVLGDLALVGLAHALGERVEVGQHPLGQRRNAAGGRPTAATGSPLRLSQSSSTFSTCSGWSVISTWLASGDHRQLGAGDALGDAAAVLRRDERVELAVQDERRHAIDGRSS
jgi:hypothetical protein